MGIKTKLMLLVSLVFVTTIYVGSRFISGEEEKLVFQMAQVKSLNAQQKIWNGLYSLMLGERYQQSGAFIASLMQVEGLAELRMIRNPILDKQYGQRPQGLPLDDFEKGIYGAKEPISREVLTQSGYALQTIYPIPLTKNFFGKDCLECHQGPEGMVAGGMVLTVPLTPFQDSLKGDQFTMKMRVTALVVLTLLVVYSLLTRYVEIPIGRVVGVAQRIAGGRLINEKLPITSDDEIGKLAKAFEEMQASLIKVSEQAKVLSQGDLTKRIDAKGDLPDSFNLMVDNLAGLVEDIREKSIQVDQESRAIFSIAQNQSGDAENQAAALEEITYTMNELSKSATRIAENSTRVLNVAKKTLTSAQSGRAAVDLSRQAMDGIRKTNEEVTQKVNQLAEKSQLIVNILDLINEIAAETKILAINASIEATRAGEAGKGFSVVANEIRKLAENVVNSTGNIRGLIEEIQTHSSESVQAIKENRISVDQGSKTTVKVAQHLVEILEIAKRTADSAHQISVATQEQNTASSQVLLALNEVSDKTQQFSDTAKESTRKAETIANMSAELKEKVSKFTIGTNDRSKPEGGG